MACQVPTLAPRVGLETKSSHNLPSAHFLSTIWELWPDFFILPIISIQTSLITRHASRKLFKSYRFWVPNDNLLGGK